jgi:outer membrane PBP1 activator LpoA protein
MMKHFRSVWTVAALSAAVLLSGLAQAMEIRQFDKMADDDQDEYAAHLVVGAIRVLREAGQSEQAEKLRHLFTDIKPGDRASQGMVELEVNLAAVSAAEAKRQARNPNLRHLTAEDAFKAVAEDHGIALPESFMTATARFQPKHPPKN